MKLFYDNIYLGEYSRTDQTRYDYMLTAHLIFLKRSDENANLDMTKVRSEINRPEEYKFDRGVEVGAIAVTLASGEVLDGNETAQTRISRVIASLNDGEVTQWVDVDGNVVTLTKAKLQEALRLASEAQTAIWVKYAALKAAL